MSIPMLPAKGWNGYPQKDNQVFRKALLTYDDYLQLPDDGKRYELMEGVLCLTPSPTVRHQRILRKLGFAMENHLLRHGLGEVFYAPLDVVLSNTCVTQPDLLYVSDKKKSVIEEKNIAGAPDLVVEILSPSSAAADRVSKSTIYARYGVPYFWVVDPEKNALEEFRLDEGIYVLVCSWTIEELFQPELFPGLEVRLSDLFA